MGGRRWQTGACLPPLPVAVVTRRPQQWPRRACAPTVGTEGAARQRPHGGLGWGIDWETASGAGDGRVSGAWLGGPRGHVSVLEVQRGQEEGKEPAHAPWVSRAVMCHGIPADERGGACQRGGGGANTSRAVFREGAPRPRLLFLQRAGTSHGGSCASRPLVPTLDQASATRGGCHSTPSRQLHPYPSTLRSYYGVIWRPYGHLCKGVDGGVFYSAKTTHCHPSASPSPPPFPAYLEPGVHDSLSALQSVSRGNLARGGAGEGGPTGNGHSPDVSDAQAPIAPEKATLRARALVRVLALQSQSRGVAQGGLLGGMKGRGRGGGEEGVVSVTGALISRYGSSSPCY